MWYFYAIYAIYASDSICQAFASENKLLQSLRKERCNSKIAQVGLFSRLTFSQLFSSDFRRPRALRYRQARGWGGTYLGFQWEFVCVVSWRGCCVWHSEPDSRQYENSTHHTPCSLSAGWFGSVLVLCSFLLILAGWRKAKPNQPVLTKKGAECQQWCWLTWRSLHH